MPASAQYRVTLEYIPNKECDVRLLRISPRQQAIWNEAVNEEPNLDVAASSNTFAKPQKTLREETEEFHKQSICLSYFEIRRCFVVLPRGHFAICDRCGSQANFRARKCLVCIIVET